MTESLTNIFHRMMFLAADLSIPGAAPAVPPAGGEVVAPPVGQAVQQVANGAAEGGGLFGAGGWWIWIIYGGIFVAFYFIFFRPQRKREKAMREMQASINTGDNIVTSGGLFGKIADIGEDCFIVEFGINRGVKIPVLKADVVGVREPKMTPPPKEVVATE